MTVNDIILSFINSGLPTPTPNYYFEDTIQEWAYSKFNIKHTSGTYSRAFRRFVNNAQLLSRHNLIIKPVKLKGKRYKAWNIVKSPSVSQTATTSSATVNSQTP